MDKKRAAEQHAGIGNLPEAWRSTAENLLVTAAVLRERRESSDPGSGRGFGDWRLHPPELMLRGFAVECLLKALWVKQGHELVKNGKFVGVRGANDHDLVQIAGVVHLTLSDLEADLLRRLSHFIEYGGRYPIPKDPEKLRLTPSPRGGRAVATHWNTPSDQDLSDRIVTRLNDLLDER